MTDLIGPHLAHCRAQGLSAQTLRARERLLRRLARDLPYGVDTASPEELEEWLGNERWSAKTRETYFGHMVGFYRWATSGRRPRLDWDPTEDFARPHAPRNLPRPVTDAQLRLALERLHHPWDRVVHIAAGVGMRAGEIATSKRADWFDHQVVILGKGGRSRSVPVDERLWAVIEPLPDGPVLGIDITPYRLSRTMAALFDRIGLADVTLHRFRHWYATVIQREYRDLRVTQELLGHQSPATTAVYAAVTDRQRRLAVNTLSAAITNALSDAA